MRTQQRVLLIEHLDATGSAAADARQHATALRCAGFVTEGLVFEGEPGTDLQFSSGDQRGGAGFDFIGRDATATLATRVRNSRADIVLWAGATPGGGEPARVLAADPRARWWCTGHAPRSAARGPLPALEESLAPFAGSALASDEPTRRRLSLWDGPFALVPVLPGGRSAVALVEAFANVADACDDAELVVLAHPDPAFERLAQQAGIGQRVHFVGPAPREAEHAWLGTALVAIVSGDAALSGGLVLRTLGSGCPVLPVGGEAAPIARWLLGEDLTWAAAGESLEDTLGSALRREPAVLAVRDRGRRVAAANDLAALGSRLAAALRAVDGRERRAA